MIDGKMLAELESFMRDTGVMDIAEIIRNARRYLALRNAGVLIVGGLQMSEYAHGSALDAAADRLLEGGNEQ